MTEDEGKVDLYNDIISSSRSNLLDVHRQSKELSAFDADVFLIEVDSNGQSKQRWAADPSGIKIYLFPGILITWWACI